MATLAVPTYRVDGERRFFTGMALALLAFTLVAFAPTYYLISVFDGVTTRGVARGESLTPLVHLHGLTCTAWLALLLAQTSLVAVNRRQIHRRLGILAVPIGLAVAATALAVALAAAKSSSVPPGWTPPQFLLIQFGTLGGFVVLTSLGLLWRQRSAFHKRLMLLGTISMMVPSGGRIWRMLDLSDYARNAIGGMILTALFILALAVFDLRSRGKLHPATLWAGGALLLAMPARVLLSGTEAWQSIGHAIIG